MKSLIFRQSVRSLAILSVLSVSVAAQASFSTFSSVYNFVNNGGNQQILSGSSVDINFTGHDSGGNSQTMTWKGEGVASSTFGRMHLYANGSLSNTYYNASNNPFAKGDGTADVNGSPDTVFTLNFAGFNDEFQYGGSLQAGYKARYFFHIDGTNVGYNPATTNVAADLAFNVEGDTTSSYFAFGNGNYNTTWVTRDYDINGITPQKLNVTFSNQVGWDLYNTPEGLNIAGTSNFSNTVTLSDIEVVDANGNYVSGWTLTTASGTQYPTQSVPEPASIIALLGGVGAALAKRRRA